MSETAWGPVLEALITAALVQLALVLIVFGAAALELWVSYSRGRRLRRRRAASAAHPARGIHEDRPPSS